MERSKQPDDDLTEAELIELLKGDNKLLDWFLAPVDPPAPGPQYFLPEDR